jgi:hypothetical protein
MLLAAKKPETFEIRVDYDVRTAAYGGDEAEKMSQNWLVEF